MKKILIGMLLVVAACQMKAQDIQVARFERNYTSLIASMNTVYDNTGEACAVIRFFVRDEGFIIEPNLGVLKREVKPGEIRIWVPKGTKRLTIRNGKWMPLTGYEIPEVIEPKVTYDAELTVTDEALQRKKANKGHNVYMGAGYNVLSISGPSVALGFDINHHNIEVGAVFGLNKTDDMFFYDNSSNVVGAFNYQAIRIQLRYGYDIKVTDFFSIKPQVGGSHNIFSGKELVKGYGDMGTASSFSAFGAISLVTSFNNRVKLHITPEYDFSLSQNYNCQLIAGYDATFKSWTEGFNLNIGLMCFF
ncbi:MAG: hypothetical protein K2I86_02020 [Prevotella sp.]|nr:hypothetical protein [Prevotella sp.]